jgi:hypothetical protein
VSLIPLTWSNRTWQGDPLTWEGLQVQAETLYRTDYPQGVPWGDLREYEQERYLGRAALRLAPRQVLTTSACAK